MPARFNAARQAVLESTRIFLTGSLSDQVVVSLREIQAVIDRYNLVFPGRNDITKPMSEASINP
jgi:hypothetical protein